MALALPIVNEEAPSVGRFLAEERRPFWAALFMPPADGRRFGQLARASVRSGEVPTQPVSETSTMTPSGPLYLTSTLPP
jgi:hypothetical protein